MGGEDEASQVQASRLPLDRLLGWLAFPLGYSLHTVILWIPEAALPPCPSPEPRAPAGQAQPVSGFPGHGPSS